VPLKNPQFLIIEETAMAKNEKTSDRIASKASKVLKNPSSGNTAKSIAGSALSQTSRDKTTSAKVASKAAKALKDGRSGKTT